MTDRVFEISLSGLTLAVLLWLALGLIFPVIGWGWVVLSSLLVEIIGAGLLLHYWGKHYLAQE